MHLLKNLEHFLSSLLSSKEFCAALIGAVIGGLMAGRYALRAQKQAAADQRQRDVEAEQRAVRGTLQAIATELKVLKVDSFDRLEKTLKERAQTRAQPPLPTTLAEQNRTIVFESNAEILGKIDDHQLRQKIIRVYGLVKGLIDNLNANTREFDRWRSLPDSHPEKQSVTNVLALLEEGLGNRSAVLQRELDELLKELEENVDP